MYEVGGVLSKTTEGAANEGVSWSLKHMPPSNSQSMFERSAEGCDEPGRRRESLTRSINANRGKWLRQANNVSKAAWSDMMASLADVNVI